MATLLKVLNNLADIKSARGVLHFASELRGDQVAVQDRLDDVLYARPLSDDLVAPGDLPAKRLCRLVRYPDFRQKAACIKLSEDAGVDRVGLDLRMSDDAHLLRIRDHNPLYMRCDHRRDRGR